MMAVDHELLAHSKHPSVAEIVAKPEEKLTAA
jgi:hypothetical protein